MKLKCPICKQSDKIRACKVEYNLYTVLCDRTDKCMTKTWSFATFTDLMGLGSTALIETAAAA